MMLATVAAGSPVQGVPTKGGGQTASGIVPPPVTATGTSKPRSLPDRFADVLNVKDFGAVGDGTTDNSRAFAAVAAKVNATAASPTVAPSVVLFPSGTYAYSGGLSFTSPVHLSGKGAVLKYLGKGVAVKLGPDGLTIKDYQNHQTYTVDGLMFTGGGQMKEGIYFNTFITQPRVTDTQFVNFGSGSSYSIFFQSQNWDARVSNCRMYANDSAVHNFIRANGMDSDGVTSDQGQSRLTVSDVLATNQALNAGTAVGIYFNGGYSSIVNSKIEGFSPVIWVGNNRGSSSDNSFIRGVYMEVIRGSNPCIMFGEAAGSYSGSYTSGLMVADSYCNVHNNTFGTKARFLGPAGKGSGLQYTLLQNNVVADATAGTPLAELNDLGSQVSNASGWNRIGRSTLIGPNPTNPLHSTGKQIPAWTGPDSDAQTRSGAAPEAIRRKRVSGCATPGGIGTSCTTVVLWDIPFADARYTVSCTGDLVSAGVPINGGVATKSADSITFQTVGATAVAAQYSVIDCIAVHD